MALIKELNSISKANLLQFGGKGASLGKMLKSRINVPKGFIILSSAFEIFMKKNALKIKISSILDSINDGEINDIEKASQKISKLILHAEIPQNIAKEIHGSFKELKTKYVAVRSSATAEDSPSSSWAGQLASYLNVPKKRLLEHVKKCWASLFTPRAIFYRFEKKLAKSKIYIAVIVQKMIEPDVSGTAFSIHPVTQNHNQVVIESGYGLGEAIVSGKITPDRYIITKQPRQILDKRISNQKKGLFSLEKGGNKWKMLGKKGSQQKLPDKEILKLAMMVLKIARLYGFPCDIEWARQKGRFYILQSRPITALTKQA
ncbi:MAG TPA: PEP/pyruvate-binding domain-containing protein [Candidatus Nanoarchaeia archaeon]|nr:PEP/pyruvate-binding domain-containing protein [Candidatus Nanoarchaeia archaeon]